MDNPLYLYDLEYKNVIGVDEAGRGPLAGPVVAAAVILKEYIGKQLPIVKGDAKSLSIAAASIIAKVTRDRLMKDLASVYPDYHFEKHKGYGTKAHIEVIKDKGAIEGVHRKVFLRKILDEPKEEQLTILG